MIYQVRLEWLGVRSLGRGYKYKEKTERVKRVCMSTEGRRIGRYIKPTSGHGWAEQGWRVPVRLVGGEGCQ